MTNIKKSTGKVTLYARRLTDPPAAIRLGWQSLKSFHSRKVRHSPVEGHRLRTSPQTRLGQNQALRESGLDGPEEPQGLFHSAGRFEGEGSIDRKGGNGGIDFGTGMSVAAFQGPAQLGKDDVGDEENPVFPSRESKRALTLRICASWSRVRSRTRAFVSGAIKSGGSSNSPPRRSLPPSVRCPVPAAPAG